MILIKEAAEFFHLYQHYYQLDCWGHLELGPDVYFLREGSASLGQVIEIFIKTDKEKITNIKAKIYGNAWGLIAAGWLCESLKEKSLKEISSFSVLGQWCFKMPQNCRGTLLLLEGMVSNLDAQLKRAVHAVTQ